MAYEVLGRNAHSEAPEDSKGDTGEKGKKGIQGMRGDNESPRSIDVGPGFGNGAADINVSSQSGSDRYASWISVLSAGTIAIDVSSASGRYKSDSLAAPIDKIVWYRYYIVGPGKISDVRLESGEDGKAVFTCQWDGLNGDAPFLTYNALVVFEYIADDGNSLLED